MILPSGGRGRGFDSRTAPVFFCFYFIFFYFLLPRIRWARAVVLGRKFRASRYGRNLERGHPLKLERYRED